ncbi:LysR family transcriptional regulator [Ochrobactrum sp. POC9]|nr:LysR family transcriptional regulator [Ochrobactrum sp. POC9]
MAMELRRLRYFVAVAEERHFGRAAERVGIGQPPLSQQIQALERELGTQLIRRIPRNIELTDAGEVLLREARVILAQTEHAIACVGRASRGELGKLRIGLTPAASFSDFVIETMDSFKKLYPDILITLHENDTAILFSALIEGEIDVGFTWPPALDDRIQLDDLFDEELLIAMPLTHPLAVNPSVAMESLADQDFIMVPRSIAPAAYDCLMAACDDASFSPRVVQEAPQMATAINLVTSGIGLTVVPASLQHIHPLEVAYCSVADAVLSASICLASRRGEPAVPVRNFVKLARKAASERRKSADLP